VAGLLAAIPSAALGQWQFSWGCDAHPASHYDPETLAESFLSHLQARNKDSKSRPKTNQSSAELAGQLTGKEALFVQSIGWRMEKCQQIPSWFW
jgi:hypothetical protein